MRPLLILTLTVLPGCSAILPLGDEYSFGGTDASTVDAGSVDASSEADAGTDAGLLCEELPTLEEACADRCGEVELCEMTFSCGGCVGELTCAGDGTANACGCAQPPCALASFRAGDVDRQNITGIAVDSDGNIFVAGNFRGTITFGSESYTNPGTVRFDMFLAKLDPQGNPLWSRAYGGVDDPSGNSEQQAQALAVDASGNVVLAGYSYTSINLGGADLPADGDTFIVKLDGDGNHIFSDTYPCTHAIYVSDLAIDPGSQDIFVTGNFYGTLQFGSLPSMTAATPGGHFDIFLAQLSPVGVPKRSEHYGDPSEQIPESITVSGNHVYLTAHFNGSFNFGAPNQVALSTTSYYALAITKLSTGISFAHQWSRQYGTDVWSSHIASHRDGSLFLSGHFGGTLDIATPPLDSVHGNAFLAHLDAEGNTVWTKQLANVLINDLTVGPDGTLYVVGQTRGSVDLGAGEVPDSGTRNAFIAHYTTDGTHVWSRVFSTDVGDQAAWGVSVTTDGTAWIAADFEGMVDFGTGKLTTAGDLDIAVISYRH